MFTVFTGDLDRAIECTFSNFTDDSKLGRNVDVMMEGQERNLDKLDRWAKDNSMRFNKAMCQVLHLTKTLGRGSPNGWDQSDWEAAWQKKDLGC